ncbi:MAG: UDP-3-O-acyl-N-acetylglucosamine deacetylase [Paracoccaceae bacterium]|nr:UDP-3-O-acyl-N-acetylglucosamine deacetylase [Paracoccaceae bacterium]
MQNTLKKEFVVSGVSLHTGSIVTMKVGPGPANSGIKFFRTDVVHKDPFIQANYNSVSDTKFSTKISNCDGIAVQTIEHLMAALAGTGVHNALIEINGPELPIMDGSSKDFVKKILLAGKHTLNEPLSGFRVTKEVEVCEGRAWAKLTPGESLSIDFCIDYSDTVIGCQNLSLLMKNGTFVRELCDSRTFCRESEIAMLKSRGLAKGGNLENAIVLEPTKIKNIGGLRRVDECVRHKMLDAMGDLSLAGGPILAAFSSNRGGHTLTNKLLREAFSDEDNMQPIIIRKDHVTQLPGFGLREADLCNLG